MKNVMKAWYKLKENHGTSAGAKRLKSKGDVMTRPSLAYCYVIVGVVANENSNEITHFHILNIANLAAAMVIFRSIKYR